ncbi:F-box only protein 44-like [Aphidius gifuensis]|nr:F-box only protein 44-like [Aphidius gifuensis]
MAIDNENQMEYEENNNNGLLICDKYIPEELLSKILIYFVDYKSLLNCQLVCKHWKYLIHNYIWRRKSELIVGQSLCSITDIPWIVYYQIIHKNPFNKNLIKNHSGQEQLKHWKVILQGGDKWIVEEPPIGVPELPSEAQFDDKQRCFVTSYSPCIKRQAISLVSQGFLPEILDNYQLSIDIGEWYSCRSDCLASYKCSIRLLDDKNKTIDTFNFDHTMTGNTQNIWHHMSHEFKNFGPGLRKIVFQHEGKDQQSWAGHYGSKMTGAYAIIKLSDGKKSLPQSTTDN